MTISPYDNLPMGNKQEKQKAAANSEAVVNGLEKITFDVQSEATDNGEPVAEDKITSVATDDLPGRTTATTGLEEETISSQAFPVVTEDRNGRVSQTMDYVEVNLDDMAEADKQAPNQLLDQVQAGEPDNKPLPGNTETFSAAKNPATTEPAQYNTIQSEPPRQEYTERPEPPRRQDFAKTTPLENAPRYSTLKLKNRWGVGEYILPFEESLLVPDTMPDMAHILFTEARSTLNPSGKNSYMKNDFLSGDITVYTVYQPDGSSDSPVDVVKSSLSFKTDKCWEKSEADSFRVTVSIKSVNAEMINERKFTTSGELLICFTEICNKELSVFQGTGSPDFLQLESTMTATDLSFETEDSIEISQDINIREDQPSPVKILKEAIDIVENHKQLTSGKLVINATINSSILYIGENDGSNQLSCITNKTDFTQFIPIKGDENINLIKPCFNSGDLKVTIEGSDKFLLQGQVRTFIQGYKNRDINMVTDTYHKERDVKFDISGQPLSYVTDTLSGEITAREVVSLKDTDKKPQHLICGSGQLRDISAKPERGRIIIEGTMVVNILALDDESKPFTVSCSIPLRGSLEMPGDGNDFTMDISAAVREFWFDEINSRQLEINVSVAIDVWMNMEETFKTIENLCFAELKEPAGRVPMALYVVNHNDTLWDIAKRYKSDTKTLAELNEIDVLRPLPEGMKLFIMK